MVVKKMVSSSELIIPTHQASWSALRPAVSQKVTDAQNISSLLSAPVKIHIMQ